MSSPGDPWREISDGLKLMDEQIERDLLRAAPFLDAHTPAGKWPACSILKILWCSACVEIELQLLGNNSRRLNAAIERVNRTAALIEEKLQIARQRYRDGFYARPFGEPVPRKTNRAPA